MSNKWFIFIHLSRLNPILSPILDEWISPLQQGLLDGNGNTIRYLDEQVMYKSVKKT